MKIYSDYNLKTEIKEIDFGIVLAGDTKEVIAFLYNDGEGEVVELKLTVDAHDVTITGLPDTLKSKESKGVTFKWTAPVSVKKGLRSALNLKYFELYSA